MYPRVAVIAALLATGSVMSAANIYVVTLQPSALPAFAPFTPVGGWSQTTGNTNVTISASLRDNTSGGPISGVEGVVYLMNQIGPGTTTANQVAAPVSISGLTASFVQHTLFSGLTLGPGNYYVVFAPTNVPGSGFASMGVEESQDSGDETTTLGTGVTDLGSAQANQQASYPPASVYALTTPGLALLSVTGTPQSGPTPTPTPTPAPSSLILLLIGLAILAVLTQRTRRENRRRAG